MALFLPTFNEEFDFFEPLLPFVPRRVRRINPVTCRLVPRCQALFPESALIAPWNFLPLSSNDLTIKKHDNGVQAELDLSGFDRDHVKVDVDKASRIVTVSGTREDKSEDGKVISARHFQRSFALPEDCSTDQISARLNKEGKLAIIAPKSEGQIESKENPQASVQQEIPIHHEEKEASVVQEQRAKAVESSSDKDSGFQFSLNVAGFDPKNVEVVVDDSGLIHVSAKQKEELEDGTVSTHEIKKRVSVDAQKYDLNELSSKVNEDGLMTFTIPEKK